MEVNEKRKFGLWGCSAEFKDGWLIVKGVDFGARARVPIQQVEFATTQRSIVQRRLGRPSVRPPQVILYGHGAELGHADLAIGNRRRAEKCAAWINQKLQEMRTAEAQQPPAYGLRSPDGHWWWDGQQWQPINPGLERAERDLKEGRS
jgi:uncharacterized protein YbdZ (MbtH family)